MKINLQTHLSEAINEKLKGGMGDDKTLQDIANKHDCPIELIELMLKWGMDVEMEHTNDKEVAREIAMDHLTEDPIYYKKLKEMEGE